MLSSESSVLIGGYLLSSESSVLIGLQLYSSRDMLDQIAKVNSVLSDTNQDWEKRIDNVRLASGYDYPPSVASLLLPPPACS